MREAWRAWPTRRWVRVGFAALVVALVSYLLYRARGALGPFILGLVLAYLLLPAVDWLQRGFPRSLRRRKTGRVLSILIVYALAGGLIAAFVLYLVPVIFSQVRQLIANREEISAGIRAIFANVAGWYTLTIPPDVQAFLEAQFVAARGELAAGIQQGIVGALAALRSVVSVILGYLIIPFWLFLVLFDVGEYRQSLIRLLPESARPDAVNVARIADDVLGSYIRGQLLVAFITATLTAIALQLLGVNFSILLGVVVFIGDLIPTLGPILAAIPTVLIAALQRPILGLWALLALIAVQQFESIFIGPRVVGQSVQVRPAMVIFLLVVGGELWGLVGLLVVVPLFALGRDIARYVDLRTAPVPVTPDGALERVRRQRRYALT